MMFSKFKTFGNETANALNTPELRRSVVARLRTARSRIVFFQVRIGP